MNKQEFRGVQALRGLAALSVMLFHFRWNINAESSGFGDILFGWGASGVDLFFLISGFVITLSAARVPCGVEGAFSFLKKRATRILPTYYIILLMTFLLSGAMSIFHYDDKAENFISALLFFPIDPHHGPFYVDDSGMYGIRWTLNYEVMFYLFISVAILFTRRWIWAIAMFAMALIVLPLLLKQGITLDVSGYPTESALVGLLTNPIIWLFFTGMLIGLSLPHISRLPAKLMTVLFLLSLFIMVILFSHGLFTGHGLLQSGWVYAVVLFCAVTAEKTLANYIPAFLIRLGDISFSLYLIHTLMNNGIGKRFSSMGVSDGYGRFVLSVMLSIGLAWLSWRFIERPVLKVGQRKTSGTRMMSEKRADI